MSAVVTLCSAAMWINDGKVIEIGSANRLVDRYTSKYSAATLANTTDITQKPRSGTGAARFSKLRVRVAHRGDSEIIVTGESLQIELEITSIGDIAGANVAVIIYDMNSTRLIDVNTALKGDFLSLGKGRKAVVTFTLDEVLLKPGIYVIDLWLGRPGIEHFDYVREAGILSVRENVNAFRHTEVFPGVYQCRFSHCIHIA